MSPYRTVQQAEMSRLQRIGKSIADFHHEMADSWYMPVIIVFALGTASVMTVALAVAHENNRAELEHLTGAECRAECVAAGFAVAEYVPGPGTCRCGEQ